MSSCASCNAQVPASELLMSSEGEVCNACFDAVEVQPFKPSPLAIAAGVAGAVPFVVSVAVNGVDYIAAGGGAAAIGLGGVVTVGALKSKRMADLGLGLAAIGLGALHLFARSGLL